MADQSVNVPPLRSGLHVVNAHGRHEQQLRVAATMRNGGLALDLELRAPSGRLDAALWRARDLGELHSDGSGR
eukprot:9240998-Pyramimonas_sp.AAC.1